jgi:hypothetical protein
LGVRVADSGSAYVPLQIVRGKITRTTVQLVRKD